MIIPAYVATLGGIWPKEPESSVPVCEALQKRALTRALISNNGSAMLAGRNTDSRDH